MKLSKEYIKSRSEVSQESDCWNWTGAGLEPAYLNTVLRTAVARLNGSYRQIVRVPPRRSA